MEKRRQDQRKEHARQADFHSLFLAISILNLKGHGNGQETENSGQTTSNGLASSAQLHVLADKGTVGNGLVGVGLGAVGRGQHLLGFGGSVADPVVGNITGKNLGVDSADDVLKHSIVHGNGTSEPVTAVVGVDETVLAVDSLVLDELEVGGLGQVVVRQDRGPSITGRGLVNDDINSGGSSGKLGSGGEGG